MERNLRAKQICWKENGTIFLLLTTLPRVDKWKPWTRSFSESSSRTVNESQRFWHEMLPNALWAYRTNARMSTGVTPYSLVYGAEAVLPLETEIPSYWLSIAADLSPSSSQYAEATVIWIRRMNVGCVLYSIWTFIEPEWLGFLYWKLSAFNLLYQPSFLLFLCFLFFLWWLLFLFYSDIFCSWRSIPFAHPRAHQLLVLLGNILYLYLFFSFLLSSVRGGACPPKGPTLPLPQTTRIRLIERRGFSDGEPRTGMEQ